MRGLKRSARGDDGVAVVEMALILPVLMMLLIGMISGAIVLNQGMALGHGTRVAGRWAATVPLPADREESTMAVWLDDVIDRVVAASEGNLDPGAPGRNVCVAYVDPSTTFARTETADGTRASSAAPCFTEQATGRHVQVAVRRDAVINTGVYRFPLTLQRQVAYRHEASLEL